MREDSESLALWGCGSSGRKPRDADKAPSIVLDAAYRLSPSHFTATVWLRTNAS